VITETTSVIVIEILNLSQNGLGPGGRKSFQLAVENAVGTPSRLVLRLTL
jgi:hypothetical protein